MRHHFHRCGHLRVLSIGASDLSKGRHGAGPILEELCDAHGLAPCVGVVECDVLTARQKRELLALRASRALGDDEAAGLFERPGDSRARELAELRDGLLEERAEIVEENRRLAGELASAVEAYDVVGPVEEAELMRRGISVRVDESARAFRLARLDAIDRAIEALRAGGYGGCARCGGPIATERLREAPDTRVCAKCARDALPETAPPGGGPSSRP